MSNFSVLFLLLGFLSLGLCIFYLLASKKPGVYPPKYILKRRAGTMAGGSVVFFLIGIIVYSF
jgi:hypothetical protein